MNCFVIMPFAPEFDDVYVAIKGGVIDATSPQACRCFRLDEARPAGRITDRLLQELRTASLCVADLTGNRPNVMWEVGFAMALGCPTIIVTQSLKDLPFDIRDMQSLEYDRNRLSATLAQPLQRAVVDTVSAQSDRKAATQPNNDLVGELLLQVADLKSMVAQAVRSWNPPGIVPPAVGTQPDPGLARLEGAWENEESGSHLYAKVVGGDLVAPYCYRGNEALTGAYFGWRKAGPYWFARYAWLKAEPAGFTFLKQESVDVLRGAWWGDEHGFSDPTTPPDRAGVPSTWRRLPSAQFPTWATQFIDEVRRTGLPSRLTRDGADGAVFA